MSSDPILAAIRALGYHVSVFCMRGGISFSGDELPVPDRYVEMHAVKMGPPNEVRVARVDAHGADAEFRCAQELARMLIADAFHR